MSNYSYPMQPVIDLKNTACEKNRWDESNLAEFDGWSRVPGNPIILINCWVL